MKVHFIWIGENEIPPIYINNYNKCFRLNYGYSFLIWKNNDCISLLKEYNLFDYWVGLSFICKCNLLKYLILDKFGGIYTDFDIDWKIPFNKIINDFGFPYKDIIITSIPRSYLTKNNQLTSLIDDPFIISKPGIFKSCIDYCINRTDLKKDGEYYFETGELRTHKLEPIGPFGLTEWLNQNDINYTHFSQETLLDHKGYFGSHAQKMTWNTKN